MRRAAGVRSDYVGGVDPDADQDPDTASEASDGESLSSEGEYEKDVVARVYRPMTVSDHSAYDIQLPASKQRQSRPDSSRAGKQASRVVDYATYTKNEAKAEVQQATGESASSPVKRETVRNKELFAGAFGGRKKASAVPDIDFTRPTSVVDAESAHLHYDPTAYGGSVYHEFAGNVHLQSVTQGARPGSASANRSRPTTSSGARNADGLASRPSTSSGGSNQRRAAAAAPAAPVEEVEDEETRKRRVEADAARRREEREQGEIERMRAEAAAVEDPDRREYLEMKALLREEALGELRRANADAAATGATKGVSAQTDKQKAEEAEKKKKAAVAAEPARTEAELAHDRHVDRVSRAMAARRAGEAYDETLLHDVPEFDLAAAGALYAATRDEVRVDTEAVEDARHRQFYDAVLSLEEVVASPGLARVTSKCLERHRQLFQRTKVARERGEFTHEEHAAFKEFTDQVQAFIFSRVAEAVGVTREEFDVEDFFTRVFEEDDDGDDDNDYPLLSNETWEVLLSMLNFESFIDLMDHYIFTRNNATTQSTTSSQRVPAAAPSSASKTAMRAAAAAADTTAAAAAASVPGVDSFVEEGRPVRRVGSADGSTTGMSRQSSSAAVGDEAARISPPPPQRRDILAAPKSPVPPTAKTPLRPAGLTPSSSAGSYGVAPSALGGSSLNARRHGALPPVGAAGAVKTKGVPLVPNASLGSKRPAGAAPKPKSAFQ